MRMLTLLAGAALGALALASPAAAQTYDADEIALHDLIGTVEIRTSDRSDVSVSISNAAEIVETPQVRLDGDRLVVRGEGRIRNLGCRGGNDRQVRVGRMGDWHDLEDYPLITIEAPADIAVRLEGGVVFGSAEDLGSARIDVDSCGDFELANIAGEAELHINGSGDLDVGDIGYGELVINGSGDMTAGASAGDLTLEINGSGDITAASVNGELSVAIRGSGDITVQEGSADPFRASIYGSGDIRFEGVAIDPRITIFGSGDVWLGSMQGSLSSSGMGSGDIHVGG